jgi:hypothetical protein
MEFDCLIGRIALERALPTDYTEWVTDQFIQGVETESHKILAGLGPELNLPSVFFTLSACGIYGHAGTPATISVKYHSLSNGPFSAPVTRWSREQPVSNVARKTHSVWMLRCAQYLSEIDQGG